MHKITYLFIFSLLISLSVFAQISKNTSDFSDNIRYGGGFNVGFGNSLTTISVSPSAIYDISNEFSAGLGLTYVYLKDKSTYNNTTHLYGGSILAFYKPINYLQLSTELEELKIDRNIYSDNYSKWQTALYVGFEYVTGNVAVGLRYDLLFDETKNVTQPSALTPVVRFYF